MPLERFTHAADAEIAGHVVCFQNRGVPSNAAERFQNGPRQRFSDDALLRRFLNVSMNRLDDKKTDQEARAMVTPVDVARPLVPVAAIRAPFLVICYI